MKTHNPAARFLSRLTCTIGMLLLLASCASLPDIGQVKESIRPLPVPTIVSADGHSLPAYRAKRLLQNRLGDEASRMEEWAATIEAATGQPLIKGNKVSLLIDGPETMAAMMKAIEAATDHVNLETYIFKQDGVGVPLAELLKKKQREGVQVNIIYDSHGTRRTPEEFFNAMRETGIRLIEFNPLNPFENSGRWRPNNRDHRKILIVDGKVAFTGGINISEDYSSASLSSSDRSLSEPGWRDTHIKVEGPAVAALQSLFMDTWTRQRGEKLDDRNYFPPLREEGNELLRVIATHPEGNYSVFKAYALAMQHARRTIHITNAYFVPDQQIIDRLIAAAQRGADVKLIFPSTTDRGLVFHAGRSYYRRLLEGGVRIFELKKSVLHAKTAVIDGIWSTVGSANLDMRSFLHNTEVNVIVLGPGFGDVMEDTFKRDLRHSEEITLEQWNRRPASERAKEWLARLFDYWL
jgi:cardiolipin synthase